MDSENGNKNRLEIPQIRIPKRSLPASDQSQSITRPTTVMRRQLRIPAPGEFLDQYRIEEQIGENSEFLIFRAYHPQLEVYRTLQLLRPVFLLNSPRTVEHFIDRASKLSSQPHPNLHNILTATYDRQQGLFYTVVENIAERKLPEISGYGQLSGSRADSIIRALAAGLTALEKSGSCHGQLTPAEIVFSEDGRDIKISGLTKLENEVADQDPYHDKRRTGIQGDLYSCGVILFEMMTGRTPVRTLSGDSAENDPRRFNSEVTGPEAAIVIRLLAPDQMTRFSCAAEFMLAANALGGTENPRLLAVKKSGEPRSAVWLRQIRQLRENGFSWWLVVDIVLALLIGLVLFSRISNWEQQPLKSSALYPELRRQTIRELKPLKRQNARLERQLSAFKREAERKRSNATP